jgi:phenylacetate-coenzyme A ligase PaaK-like adenylate-forming protein
MASRLMKVYEVSPRFIQTAGINIIEMGNWAIDNSGTTRHFLETIKDAQTWNNEKFLDYQSKRLREMVRYAYENVPFYKRLYDHP